MSQDHKHDDAVIDSTGSVYADLGIELSEDDMLKICVARAITNIVNAGEYTQTKAAEIMGIDQPKVSKILRGRLGEFSFEWLMEKLTLLGYDIEFRYKKARRGKGRVKMVA